MTGGKGREIAMDLLVSVVGPALVGMGLSVFTVPNDMKEGEYDVYLRFAAPLKDEAVGAVPRRPIRFANADMWNDELKANAFGKVEVR